MKKFACLLTVALLLRLHRIGPNAAGSNPKRPSSSPMRLNCPYHFGKRPGRAAMANSSAMSRRWPSRPNGNLIVFNRNPAIMMVEYDPTGTKVLRVFNPNIAMNPHGIRIDRHGNIWIIDSFTRTSSGS